MLDVLLIVLPVFIIVAAGYAANRARLFPDSGVDGLMTFTAKFAVPCLLFSAMYGLDLGGAFDPELLVSFYAAAVTCFAIGIFLSRKIWKRRPGESVAVGFNALFSNSVLIGIPIMTRAYGEEALGPMFAIIAIHAPFCYTVGITAMEFSRRDGASVFATVKKVVKSISSNALALGLAGGLTLNFLDIALPDFFMDSVDMMARAALPAALFGLGGALTRYSLKAELGEASMVSILSTIAHPAIAYGLARHVFDLPEELVRAAVLTAAMPTGMNGYIFASSYGRAIGLSASAILLGTAASVGTISIWLIVLGGAHF
jgi:malonate transporter